MTDIDSKRATVTLLPRWSVSLAEFLVPTIPDLSRTVFVYSAVPGVE